MKKEEWNEGLNHLRTDLIEDFILLNDNIEIRRKRKTLLIRAVALTACICIVIGAIAPMVLRRHTDTIPGERAQIPSISPNYYSISTDKRYYFGTHTQQVANPPGISVTARLTEILSDTYTFFNDQDQKEYRILKMEVLKVLKGQNMTEEFYYLIPIKYMVDFSKFDRFLILNMSQLTYEYSVLYNKTKDCAEIFDHIIFEYERNYYGSNNLGDKIKAFNRIGFFDFRLWNSNDVWKSRTKGASKNWWKFFHIRKAERSAKKESEKHLYVNQLDDCGEEVIEKIAELKSLENGVYIPLYSSGSTILSSVEKTGSMTCVRYVNGFPTNERLEISVSASNEINTSAIRYTESRFTEEDINTFPDLTSAIGAVKEDLKNGRLTPPHIKNYEELTSAGYDIFPWYAKTENGVLGIVRLTWYYNKDKTTYVDDAYYIIEFGADEYYGIDRDALLEKLTEYDYYVFHGEYNDKGKITYHICI